MCYAEDAEETFPDVDDTDGLDPSAEFEEWKLRELMRIKRDKEALYASVSYSLRPLALIADLALIRAVERRSARKWRLVVLCLRR